MHDFSIRSNKDEIMDDLGCSGEVVGQTLRELEVINRLLGGNYVTTNGVNALLKDHPKDIPVTIADLGCGGGDILKLLAVKIRRLGIKARFTGIDANPNIVGFAAANTSDMPEIKYERLNIFSDSFREKQFDIVIATLFFHHFSSEQLSVVFNQLKTQARIGIVVNDIHRHWLAYHSIRLLTRFFSRSAMVKYDAPLSVLRSFRKHDWKQILEGAGILDYTIRWRWAFRWQVIIKC